MNIILEFEDTTYQLTQSGKRGMWRNNTNDIIINGTKIDEKSIYIPKCKNDEFPSYNF